MKKIVTSTLLTLSAIPFAFWKMESDPCVQMYDSYYHGWGYGNNNITLPRMIKEDPQNCLSLGICYLFSYNKETGYTIAYTDLYPSRNRFAKYVNFFKHGNPSIFNNQNQISFVFIEETPNLKITYQYIPIECICPESKNINQMTADLDNQLDLWTEENCFNPQGILGSIFLKGTELFYKNFYVDYRNNTQKLTLKENFLKERAVKLSTEFKTSSGVTITNKKDQVEISQEGKKPKNFQKVLQDYFDIDNRNTRLATNWQSSKSISARLLNSLYSFRPTSAQVNLLNNSQILSVFGTFKKNRIESIIWGFAKDKETGEKFHWITDLKTDISFLLNE